MQQKGDIINDITKEMFVECLKTCIRNTYPNNIAEAYCRQIDDMSHFSKLLDLMKKYNRND